MSLIGGPITNGLAGAPKAQGNASQVKSKKDAEKQRKSARFKDTLDLKVDGVEEPQAVKKPGENASEDAHQDHEAQTKQWTAEQRILQTPYQNQPLNNTDSEEPKPIDTTHADAKPSNTKRIDNIPASQDNTIHPESDCDDAPPPPHHIDVTG